ncbi:MAG TPA: hypothetical protein VFQ60_04550 [Patescibacteria group bacterium]|nr:hypothetical protein [Patescibacteria group bacterium]
MAAEATHVVLTELVFDEFFSYFSKSDFIIGTLFPDIRYLGVIDRARTHLADFDLKYIQSEESAFIAGMKFHHLVDQIREHFMVEHGLYSLCPKFDYQTQAIKLLEDERYYSKIDTWSLERAYLEGIPDEEAGFGIAEASIQKWHSILQAYFLQPPTDLSRTEFMASIGFKKEIADSFNGYLQEIRKNNVFSIIDDFFRVFPELVKNSA